MSKDEVVPADTGQVLRRAIELDHLVDSDLSGESLDQKALAEIAAEVGISPTALAAAVADGQVGVLEKRTIVDRLVGPRVVWSSRVVSTDEGEARELVLEWLTVAHGLKPRVRPDGVIVAKRRRDLAGKLGQGLRRVQGVGGLGAANRVQAAAVGADTDDDETAESSISLAADIGSRRKDAIVGGSVATAGLSAVVGMTVIVAGPVAWVGIPVAAGFGTLVARRVHRTTVVKITESVDETVDAVAQGDEPPRPRGSTVRRRRRG